ncbi:MAG: hypothetical protein PHW60_01015 [Kiritimatiellae bacterium]|nr:hypothetical protein [Kiritimatiellia bacterium]
MNFILAWIYKYRTVLGGLLFTAAAGGLAHAAWSSSGWNVAQDGMLLATSRRILEGQVPYRDFIWSQMPLALWLHAPLTAWAGDALFLQARAIIWFQLAALAWIWAWMVNRVLRRPLGALGLPLMAVIAFGGAGYSFLPIESDTVNALFLSTLGLALRLGAPAGPSGSARRWLGYSLLGLAALCKQSFWIFPPAVVLALGDGRRLSAWLAAAWPMMGLILYLSIVGALYAAWQQVFTGTLPLVWYWNALIAYSMNGLYAYLAMRWMEGVPPLNVPAKARWLQRLAGAGMWGLTAVLLARLILYTAAAKTAAMLFWSLIGAWSYFLLERRPAARADVLIGFLAWWLGLAACSFDDQRVLVLTAGIMSLPLLIWIWRIAPRRWIRVAGVAATAAVWLALSHYAQEVRPDPLVSRRYRSPPTLDAPRGECVYSLTGVLAGGAGLNTSSNVYAVILDLHEAVRRAEQTGHAYAILPDMPGHWARSTALNPLPLDWVANPELSDSALQEQVVRALESRRGRLVIIVQKFQGRVLWRDERRQYNWPLPVAYTRKYFKRIAETQYFELYQ